MEKILKTSGLGMLLIASALLVSDIPAVQAENPNEIVVIANKRFAAPSLSPVDVKRMFKKELTNYHGTKLKPIHARKGAALRQAFVSRLLGMNPQAELKYWQDMRVRKGISPPAELSNTVRAVFSAPGAISYCYRRDFNPATAKIVLTL